MTKDKDGLGKRLAYYIKKGIKQNRIHENCQNGLCPSPSYHQGAVRTWNGNVKKTVNQFPDLSLNWLVSGKGDSYEPTQEEMYELDELHVLTTERDLSPISCLNNYLKEQFEWQTLKMKIMERNS